MERDVPAVMADGVTLRADVYRPAGESENPVLLCRTAYGKRGELFLRPLEQTAAEIADRGSSLIDQSGGA
jgi:predicted acyl esterase